ncbi:zuotin SCDLUD_004432 [Saccharomycodes ludwigii]|uniref:zuotin n=1 Tax=Saccharomycodes ludwigii TaxID=36035 RepID=UPI001E82F17B|nr:hypothetical protein SCDLUD_004432 [Saccharomycodes ludwigii]KAH3899011.1 hypothetical protein SCDLUD_004432 [Saccharomycodes ludwigii]
MSFTLPTLTKERAISNSSAKLHTTTRIIEPVGQHFVHHAQRSLRDHTFSEFEQYLTEKRGANGNDSSNVDPDEALFDTELADESLLEHDPREWKTADLYAALGLSKLRYNATDDQIIKAHRKQVLKYHPDKTSAAGGTLEQDGIFKIIQKAFETVTDANKRRQYDSVDSVADVEPPKKGSKYDFYESWEPVFVAEGRFSKKTPVPVLGTSSSTKKEVENFYAFWNRFESWRTFEFLDEDVPDDTSNRDHKRYIERKNKAARDKKKTADNARLVKLVERAFSEDPRIKQFKEEEKKEKERKKWEREAGARAEAEAKAKAEAESKAKAEAEAEAAAKSKASNKKAKEAAKSARKKNKRSIRNAPKENDYFGDADKAASIDEQTSLIVDSLDDEQLAEVVQNLKTDAKKALSDIAKVLCDNNKLTTSLVTYFV